MNRRHFIGGLASALAGFTILPAATTYGRVWKAVRSPVWIPNPEWVNAPYALQFLFWPIGPVGNDDPFQLPIRFSEKPPLKVWLDSDSFRQWADKNAVPRLIEQTKSY